MKKIAIIITVVIAMVGMSGCTKNVASTEVASDTVTVGSENGSSTNNNGKGMNSVYFGYDSNRIKTAEKEKIAKDASALKEKEQVKVEGNSDEFGTDEYNYALGLRRAKAVKDSMVAKGVSSKNITVVSYGESNPVCQDGTKECYRKNRRADYK